MECSDAELSILFTTDREIKKLNSSYRGKHKPTDVLSFPLREGVGGKIAGNTLGDIVISLETTKRQAKELGVTIKEELLRLLIHGLLHLLGYDHERVSPAKARKMRAQEERLFSLF